MIFERFMMFLYFACVIYWAMSAARDMSQR